MFCKKCGQPLNSNSKFCGRCGTQIDEINSKLINYNTEKSSKNDLEKKSTRSGNNKPPKTIVVAGFLIVLIALGLPVLNKFGFGHVGKQVSLQKSENGEGADSEEPEFTDEFKMDKEYRSGFMQEGEQYTQAPKGYTEIYTPEDLRKISDSNNGAYMLMKDLDMSGIEWKKFDFDGILDGNYHVISHIDSCLFARTKGTIKNLGVEDAKTKGAVLINLMLDGELNNCYVTGTVSGSGGLVGSIDLDYGYFRESINITYCYNAANVSDKEDRSDGVGGIIGNMDLSDTSEKYNSFQVNIRNCENYGEIEADSPAGGIIGYIRRGPLLNGYYAEQNISVVCSGCFNYGEISGNGYAGGIIGHINIINASKSLKNTVTMQQCANYNNISVPESSSPKFDNACGGICGEIESWVNGGNHLVAVDIINCLNTADTSNLDGEGGEMCGATAMNGGTCTITRCLGIGNQGKARGKDISVNNTTPVFESNEYYSKSDISIAEMKNIKENLPTFDYPYPWGIDEYFCGFPHPYGDDESEAVLSFANEKSEKEADELLNSTGADEIVLNQHYAEALEMMGLGGYWPDDEDRENYCQYLLEWNENSQTYFSLFDIDNDGKTELVVKCMDYIFDIYSFEDTSGKMIKEYEADNSEKWSTDYGNQSEINWIKLKNENYKKYTDAYMKYYENLLLKDFPKDIGTVYLQENGDVDSVADIIESTYDVSFEKNDYEIEGNYQGKTVISMYLEEGGGLEYLEKIDGVTMFGIYPGMEESKAKEIIAKYGFYNGSYSYKMGNCKLIMNTEGGVVKFINVYWGSDYVG